jgi:hypothetical protein
MIASGSLPITEQFRHPDTQRQGDPDQILQRRIPPGRFNPGEICPVNPRFLGEAFL